MTGTLAHLLKCNVSLEGTLLLGMESKAFAGTIGTTHPIASSGIKYHSHCRGTYAFWIISQAPSSAASHIADIVP